MRKYTLEEKMQVCKNCPKWNDITHYLGETRCNEVGAEIKEVEGCAAWDTFWSWEKTFGQESQSGEK